MGFDLALFAKLFLKGDYPAIKKMRLDDPTMQEIIGKSSALSIFGIKCQISPNQSLPNKGPNDLSSIAYLRFTAYAGKASIYIHHIGGNRGNYHWEWG